VPDAALCQLAARTLPEVDARLRGAYGTAPLGNKADPLDELIFIQLSIRTREGAYSDVYNNLVEVVAGNWENLLVLPRKILISVLRPGGMAAVKLERLRSQIRQLQHAFGVATLEPLRSLETHEAEAFLLTLPGVGRKAARCVLMYSLDRDVFPVDSHCRRVLARLGFLSPDIDRKAADDFLQVLVPAPLRRTLHVNLVHHGRAVCLPANPRCGACPVLSLCPTGTSRITASSVSD
jgi:endonuclease III